MQEAKEGWRLDRVKKDSVEREKKKVQSIKFNKLEFMKKLIIFYFQISSWTDGNFVKHLRLSRPGHLKGC